eukprot:TRINITY_DN5073_c0_g1_i13.p2 TRINITY_DN5073_c0_g1~~TRINITY_DN5073_c0_g1_i13.p2  ORF type:complete len:103 (-),score=14.04 TRINITY_DN5073_c0_g1_i13:490-798(-)
MDTLEKLDEIKFGQKHEIVAELLWKAAEKSDSAYGSSITLPLVATSCFDSKAVPPISLCSYFSRISKYTHCSSSSFLLAFIYIDRILSHNPRLCLRKLNIHR